MKDKYGIVTYIIRNRVSKEFLVDHSSTKWPAPTTTTNRKEAMEFTSVEEARGYLEKKYGSLYGQHSFVILKNTWFGTSALADLSRLEIASYTIGTVSLAAYAILQAVM